MKVFNIKAINTSILEQTSEIIVNNSNFYSVFEVLFNAQGQDESEIERIPFSRGSVLYLAKYLDNNRKHPISIRNWGLSMGYVQASLLPEPISQFNIQFEKQNSNSIGLMVFYDFPIRPTQGLSIVPASIYMV